MLNIERCSAPQLLGLPYQHIMIDEDWKRGGFLRSSPRAKMSPRAIDWSILRTQMDICIYFLHISCHFVTSYIDTWIIVLSSTAALRLSANNIFSIRKLDCNLFWLRVIVYIFAYGSKIVLYYLTVNWRGTVYLIGICQTFGALCQRMSYMYHSLRL